MTTVHLELLAVEVCRTIKGVELDICNTPGTALMNDATQQVIYTPPEGEDVLRSKLANWERCIHETEEIDPLFRLAVMHYQFERSTRSSTESAAPDAC